jgi:sugar/nucleoside kinase (ribokinase family)
MNLIDADRAELLYDRMGPAVETSGGSAGNTAAGVASLGGRAAFFGKVADDHLGGIYRHDIRAQGVAFDTHPLAGTPPTARSMIFVTPDGERSMNTYLGACVELGPDDIEQDKVAGSAGYLLRGLSVGSAARQGCDPQGRRDRPCQWPRDVDDPVRPVLRRPVPRRIPRPDAFRHGRHRLRQ